MNSLPTAGPWATRSEYLIDAALDSALAASPEQLRVMLPIARPQALFPSRAGQTMPWTIDQVLNIDRRTPTFRSWISGLPVERNLNINPDTIQAGSRNSTSEQFR